MQRLDQQSTRGNAVLEACQCQHCFMCLLISRLCTVAFVWVRCTWVHIHYLKYAVWPPEEYEAVHTVQMGYDEHTWKEVLHPAELDGAE